MTPKEIQDLCYQVIQDKGYAKLGVILTIPKGSLPRGFPKGELLNEYKRNGIIERTSSYDPHKVLAWLHKYRNVLDLGD
jgi:hypothetical protein